MFYPVPYKYHDLIVDRRDPRPLRLLDRLALREASHVRKASR